MTFTVDGHKIHDKIHKVADCCLLLKESTDMEGMQRLTTTVTAVCCTGSTHLSDRRRYREPSVHVAQHSRHFHALDSHLHADNITTQGVRIWLSSNNWAEALLRGRWEWHRLVQLHAAASFG